MMLLLLQRLLQRLRPGPLRLLRQGLLPMPMLQMMTLRLGLLLLRQGLLKLLLLLLLLMPMLFSFGPNPGTVMSGKILDWRGGLRRVMSFRRFRLS